PERRHHRSYDKPRGPPCGRQVPVGAGPVYPPGAAAGAGEAGQGRDVRSRAGAGAGGAMTYPISLAPTKTRISSGWSCLAARVLIPAALKALQSELMRSSVSAVPSFTNIVTPRPARPWPKPAWT